MRMTFGRSHVCGYGCLILLSAGITFQAGCCKHLAGRPKRIRLVNNDRPSAFEASLIELEREYDETDTTSQRRQEIRDEYARKMVDAIDAYYEDFVDDLVAQRKGFEASADIAAIGLDTASVLFTPVATKSILSGLSALTTASKASIDKVYFYEQTLPALISQMEANRQAVHADLTEGLSTAINVYSLGQAKRDLKRFYTAGTIDGAITEIQLQAAKKAEDAQARIRKKVDSDITASHDRRTRAYDFMSDPASFTAMRAAIKTWWAGLMKDQRFERIDLIQQSASKFHVPLDKLKKGDEIDPDLVGSWLDTLEWSETNRSLLADVVGLASAMEFPEK
jgi:hypothetical protein